MNGLRFAFVGLIALAGSSAQAGTTSTTDFATWATGIGSFVFGNFGDVPTLDGTSTQMYGGYNPLSGYSDLEGVSFSTSNQGGVINVNPPGFYGADDWAFPYAVNSSYTGDGPDVITITLPSARTAFAVDFTTLFSSTTATFTLSNGYSTTFPDTATLGITDGVKNFDFIGFISTTPFTTITISVPNQDSLVITSFDYDVTNASAAPEPATWALMAVGFAVLGCVGRLRRRVPEACRL